jgi:hypothetical protein
VVIGTVVNVKDRTPWLEISSHLKKTIRQKPCGLRQLRAVKTTISASDGIVKESREKLFTELRISAEKNRAAAESLLTELRVRRGKFLAGQLPPKVYILV